MATSRIQDSKVQAITEWIGDDEWKERDGALSIGVWRRLALVDRSVYASNRIAEMLIRDQRGKSDARDNPEVSYQGLPACEVEALNLAMLELGKRAEETLEEVRQNDRGCCGTPRAQS